jgi:hypothetical protein
MTEARWIAWVSAASWLVATAATRGAFAAELLLGMLAPLVAVIASWLAAERAYRLHPERLTATMIAGFAAKVVFFGAYVTLTLTSFPVRPIPFVVSFTGYFIGLYVTEAICLHRLFRNPSARLPGAWGM